MDRSNAFGTDAIIAAVKELGHCFSFNTAGGVFAICRKSSVEDAEASYNRKVGEHVVSAADKVTLLVMPTIVFAGSQSVHRPIHSGILTNSKCFLVKEVLKKMYGVSLNFDYSDKEDLGHLLHMKDVLFRRDSRIYVPFTGKFSPIWQLYSKYDKDRALAILFQNIPII